MRGGVLLNWKKFIRGGKVMEKEEIEEKNLTEIERLKKIRTSVIVVLLLSMYGGGLQIIGTFLQVINAKKNVDINENYKKQYKLMKIIAIVFLITSIIGIATAILLTTIVMKNNSDYIGFAIAMPMIPSLVLFIIYIILSIKYILTINKSIEELMPKKEIKITSERASFEGESNFDGWLVQYYGIKILCFILKVCTLFIAYPFTICIKEKWRCKHTTYNGRRLSFDGNGVQLIGKYLLWIILSICTFGIYLFFLAKNIEKWKCKHTHIEGVEPIEEGTYTGSSLVAFFLKQLCLILNVCTLFILVPITTVWKYKYMVNHRKYDGYKIKFDGNGIQLIGRFILWILLSVVTFGIYALFVVIRLEKWKLSHTSISEN